MALCRFFCASDSATEDDNFSLELPVPPKVGNSLILETATSGQVICDINAVALSVSLDRKSFCYAVHYTFQKQRHGFFG